MDASFPAMALLRDGAKAGPSPRKARLQTDRFISRNTSASSRVEANLVSRERTSAHTARPHVIGGVTTLGGESLECPCTTGACIERFSQQNSSRFGRGDANMRL